MKIDIFCHILPLKFKESFQKINGSQTFIRMHDIIPTLSDLNQRFRIMDEYKDLTQVLTLTLPPVEKFAEPAKALDLAKLANDGMAELITKYPDRFIAAVATVPMNDMDAALKELERAIVDLHLKGVQIFTPTNDKPLDSPEFFPLYERMCKYDLPIWIHPSREPDYADFRSEKFSKYALHSMFGWVYETSTAMVRLVLSGVMEKYPAIKFITHHGGAMVPFLQNRIASFIDFSSKRMGMQTTENLKGPPLDYFKMFYADTAIYGNTPGLMCSYSLYGASHLVFGTDMPYDSEYGAILTRETIKAVEQMAISSNEKKMIFEKNARKLLKLPIK